MEEVDFKVKWRDKVRELYDIPVNISNDELLWQIVKDFLRPELMLTGKKILNTVRPKFNLKRWIKKTGFNDNDDDSVVRGVLLLPELLDSVEGSESKNEDEKEQKIVEYEEKVKNLEKEIEVMKKKVQDGERLANLTRELRKENLELKRMNEESVKEKRALSKELESLRAENKSLKNLKSEEEAKGKMEVKKKSKYVWETTKSSVLHAKGMSGNKTFWGPVLRKGGVASHVIKIRISEASAVGSYGSPQIHFGVIPSSKRLEMGSGTFIGSVGWCYGQECRSGTSSTYIFTSKLNGNQSVGIPCPYIEREVVSINIDYKKRMIQFFVNGKLYRRLENVLISGDLYVAVLLYSGNATFELMDIESVAQ